MQPKPKGYSQKFQAGQPPIVPRAEKEKPSAQPWDKEVEEVLARGPSGRENAPERRNATRFQRSRECPNKQTKVGEGEVETLESTIKNEL